MKSNDNSFFSLPNIKFSDGNKERDLKRKRLVPPRDKYFINRIESENEWKQEYYIIYNSYILEDKES